MTTNNTLSAFFCDVKIRLGEYEKHTQKVALAKTAEDAAATAVHGDCHCNDLEWTSRSEVIDDGGGMIYSCYPQKITMAEYEVLRKYLPASTHDEESLMGDPGYAEMMAKQN